MVILVYKWRVNKSDKMPGRIMTEVLMRKPRTITQYGFRLVLAGLTTVATLSLGTLPRAQAQETAPGSILFPAICAPVTLGQAQRQALDS
jgi:hypothetical protein